VCRAKPALRTTASYGSGADLLLSRTLSRFPEIGDDECAICALECSHETARIEQIRMDHFNISRSERSRGVARRIAGRHPYFELALGEQRVHDDAALETRSADDADDALCH
jgi:hypothetical protein